MYWSRTDNIFNFLSWLLLCLIWFMGGYLVSTHLFHPKRRERLFVGLAVGLLLFIVFSNLLAHILPLEMAFWGAAVLVLALGVVAAWRSNEGFSFVKSHSWFQKENLQFWPQIVAFTGLLVLFAQINRGLAIFDDYFNLPLISMIATGDVPPHFHLNTGNWLAYHYGLHLFSASLMRIGGFFPWSAFDLGKALSLALAAILAWFWVRRITGNQWASFFGSLLVMLGGGARWLLLLLPQSWEIKLGAGLKLLGSAAATGPDLYTVLSRPWKIEGGGPLAFPFAYVNGIFSPLIMALASAGALPQLTLILLLLLARRRWQPFSGVVYGLLLASLALTGEHLFVIFCVGILLVIGFDVLYGVLYRPRRPFSAKSYFAKSLHWGWVLIPAIGIALLQGGVITEVLRGLVGQLINKSAGSSYGFSGFTFQWPPALLSAHFGALSLVKPAQVVIALAEIGPVLFLSPFVTWWAVRQIRRGRWVIACLALGSGLGFVVSLFIQYGMERDISRLAGSALYIWMLLGFPLAWLTWQNSNDVRTVSARLYHWRPRFWLGTGFIITILGGVTIFSIQLSAISHPQFTYFVQDADALMAKKNWDGLDKGVQIVDPDYPYRAVTLFGRGAGKAFQDTYRALPEWQALVQEANPVKLARAGYSYLYVDKTWWKNLTPQQRESLKKECVTRQAEQTTDDQDFRWLLDIRKCR